MRGQPADRVVLHQDIEYVFFSHSGAKIYLTTKLFLVLIIWLRT